MVVLQDTMLVLDESALTGESTPLSKTSIDPADRDISYDPKVHKRQTISAGTSILECSAMKADLGIVIKTGSFTSNGEMFREMLSFKRHKFKFDRQIKIVLSILFLYGLFGFCMTGFC
jgi:magnesium-transporting ATPase (P-type)